MSDDPQQSLRVVSSPASVRPFGEGLTDMAQRFCEEFVLNGGKGEDAAIAAGYGGGARNMATRNLCKPKVLAEIKRLSVINASAHLPVAIATLLEIMEDQDIDPRARVQAAVAILDRGGLHVPKGSSTVAVQVNMNGSTAQAIIQEVHDARSARLTQQDGS